MSVGAGLALAITLALYWLRNIATLVAAFVLARRNGQQLKSVSTSLVHGFTAEFYENSVRTHK